MLTHLEDVKWHIILAILMESVKSENPHNTITKLFEWYYNALMPTHTCMEQNLLTTIQPLTPLMPNKRRLENHQLPLLHT